MRICPACNAICEDNTKYCDNCGAELFDVAVKKIICPECGAGNPEKNAFCDSCGCTLHRADINTDIVCPSCGGKNPAGATFCNECGNNLKLTQSVATAPRVEAQRPVQPVSEPRVEAQRPVQPVQPREQIEYERVASRAPGRGNVNRAQPTMESDPNLKGSDKNILSDKRVKLGILAAGVIILLVIVIVAISTAVSNSSLKLQGKTLTEAKAVLEKKGYEYELIATAVESFDISNEYVVASYSSEVAGTIYNDKIEKNADKVSIYYNVPYATIDKVEKYSDGALAITFINNYTSMMENLGFTVSTADKKGNEVTSSVATSKGTYCPAGGNALVTGTYTAGGEYAVISGLTFRFSDGKTVTLTGSRSYEIATLGICEETTATEPVTASDGGVVKSSGKNLNANDCTDGDAVFVGVVKTNEGSDLNQRDDSSTNGNIVATLKSGTVLTISKINNGWGYCVYEDKAGWVFLDYIECCYTSNTDVNVYASGDTSSVASTITAGTEIYLNSIKGEFGAVDGGYVKISDLNPKY